MTHLWVIAIKLRPGRAILIPVLTQEWRHTLCACNVKEAECHFVLRRHVDRKGVRKHITTGFNIILILREVLGEWFEVRDHLSKRKDA